MTKLIETLLSHDPILIAAAKTRFQKELNYLPKSEWKQKIMIINTQQNAANF